VCVEPAHIPIRGIFPARVLSRVGTETQEQLSQTGRPKAEIAEDHTCVLLANFSDTPLVVPKVSHWSRREGPRKRSEPHTCRKPVRRGHENERP
jgi:hypothetical protein